MPKWIVFTFDVVAAGGIMLVLDRLGRLYRRFRPAGGPGGKDGVEPWRYGPRGPHRGPHTRGPRSDRAARAVPSRR